MMHMCGCLLLQYGPYGVCLKNSYVKGLESARMPNITSM